MPTPTQQRPTLSDGWGAPIGTGIGAGFGLVLGLLLGQLALGLAVGAAVGLVIGAVSTTARDTPTDRRRVVVASALAIQGVGRWPTPVGTFMGWLLLILMQDDFRSVPHA